ncbi:quinon protein alcohol dehydrogenase-like superfamily [Blastocladiella britannica]|nr:quinon protein alcohol dehydrogenase-like superfamily [Blastocladiella britannica]
MEMDNHIDDDNNGSLDPPPPPQSFSFADIDMDALALFEARLTTPNPSHAESGGDGDSDIFVADDDDVDEDRDDEEDIDNASPFPVSSSPSSSANHRSNRRKRRDRCSCPELADDDANSADLNDGTGPHAPIAAAATSSSSSSPSPWPTTPHATTTAPFSFASLDVDQLALLQHMLDSGGDAPLHLADGFLGFHNQSSDDEDAVPEDSNFEAAAPPSPLMMLTPTTVPLVSPIPPELVDPDAVIPLPSVTTLPPPPPPPPPPLLSGTQSPFTNPVQPMSYGMYLLGTSALVDPEDFGTAIDPDEDEFDHSYMVGDLGELDDADTDPGMSESDEMDSDQGSDEDGGHNDQEPLTEITRAAYLQGVDPQGIDWPSVPVSRAEYRQTRDASYRSYRNTEDDLMHISVKAKILRPSPGCYHFEYTKLSTKVSYCHFQLRNLVWAPTLSHVIYTHDTVVRAWDANTRTSRTLVDCFSDARATPRGPVRLSTLCADAEVLVAGGYAGEYVIRPLRRGAPPVSGVMTDAANGITNQIELAYDRAGVLGAIVSSNDAKVRRMAVETRVTVMQLDLDWAVNCATQSPNQQMLCVVGDSADTLLYDARNGTQIASCNGHADFSFAAAWSPNGQHFATGNQDKSCRIYDIRNLSKTLHVLKSRIGAVRSLRYSAYDGTLAIAEDADYVSLVDARVGAVQALDFFGEISGIAFSPDGAALYVGNADAAYGSLVEYRRRGGQTDACKWGGVVGLPEEPGGVDDCRRRVSSSGLASPSMSIVPWE